MSLVRLVGLTILCGILALVITPANAVAPSDFNADKLVSFPSIDNLPDPNSIFDAINVQRVQNGLKPLVKSEVLSKAAQERANDMQKNNYYAHKGSNGLFFGSLLKASPFADSYACENLDLQFTIKAETYVSDWLKSNAGHRECALNAKVSSAGYAAIEVAPRAGEDMRTFIVVAIHATK